SENDNATTLTLEMDAVADGDIMRILLTDDSNNAAVITYSVTIDGVFPQYEVTVIDGVIAGGGSTGDFNAGELIGVTANTPPLDHYFAYWSSNSDDVIFANAESATTTFVMPAAAVEVTANFMPVLTCPEGQELDGNECKAIICPEGQKLEGSECKAITCPEGQKLEGSECKAITCPEGQKLEGSECKAITCPEGQKLEGSECKAITCPEGQKLEGSECKAITCSEGQKLDGNECKATPILNRENRIIGAIGVQTIYYNLKGEPLGTQKPTIPGIYIEKQGTQTKKIMIR
ncbi:MAG: hypothetical protein FWH22_11635, partial [Fibromonadales bacterium]|nr:hypothetical protein [Fibromonadales bacterium]